MPCFLIELRAVGLSTEIGRRVPLIYKGRRLDSSLVVDLIIDDAVLVEVKAVETIARVHQAQVLTYLKLTGLAVGLLINFNVFALRDGVRRLMHPHLYTRPPHNDSRKEPF